MTIQSLEPRFKDCLNGNDILSILDNIVEDIEQENINSCAEVFAA